MPTNLSLLPEFEEALLAMDRIQTKRILDLALASQPAIAVVEQLVLPALEHLGNNWETGVLALSQIYMGGRICEELVDEILPPASPDRINQPLMAIAMLEDFHFLGKRIVYSTLRASGYELADYGRMDVDGLVARAKQDQIEVLLVSTLMLNSALRIKDVSTKLSTAGLDIKLVVGGAPFRFDAELWREVGAYATSPTASGVIPIVKRLTEIKAQCLRE